jgi:hypothetical protein
MKEVLSKKDLLPLFSYPVLCFAAGNLSVAFSMYITYLHSNTALLFLQCGVECVFKQLECTLSYVCFDIIGPAAKYVDRKCGKCSIRVTITNNVEIMFDGSTLNIHKVENFDADKYSVDIMK